MSPRFFDLVAPPLFVVLWATGFVFARLVAPHADPFTFLALRFALASACLAGLAAVAGASWPRSVAAWRDAAASGMLLQGIYLGGVFWAIANGLPAGISALIAGTQPLLVALLAPALLGERVSLRRWAGIFLGFGGIALVLSPKLGGPDAYSPASLAASVASTLAITAGTLLQKRTGSREDLRSGGAVQFGTASVLMLLAAVSFEPMRIEPAPAFWVALGWSVLALSIGAVGLLLMMLKRGAAVAVSSLLFLVPPVSALMSYALFGETLTLVQAAGMAVATAGVAVVTRP